MGLCGRKRAGEVDTERMKGVRSGGVGRDESSAVAGAEGAGRRTRRKRAPGSKRRGDESFCF